MSHSTFIEVTVGLTTVSYTYGTGSVADMLGVYEIGEPYRLVGRAAVELIKEGKILPRRHMFLALEELDDLGDLYGDDFSYMKSVSVCITRYD